MSNTTKPCRYLKIGSLYLSLEQNVAVLIWLLYKKGRPFIADWGRQYPLLKPMSGAVRFYKVLRFTWPYLKKRYGRRRRSMSPLLLSIPGQVACRMRTGGYKVFDIRRDTVTTLFPAELDVAILQDVIDQTREIGKHEFAPTVRRWHLEERWVEESYIDGLSSKHLNKSWWVFDKNFRPLLEEIMLAEPPKMVDVHAYIAHRQGILAKIGELRSESWGSKEGLARLRDFVTHMSKQIQRSSRGELGLVLSHGDFAARNVLISSGRPFIIDWDTWDFRSALHDVYFVFLMTQERKDRPDLAVLAVKLDQALAQVKEAVSRARPEVAAKLFPATLPEEAYRWLFYIEHICMVLEEILRTTDEAAAKWRFTHLMTHLTIFERFEGLSHGVVR